MEGWRPPPRLERRGLKLPDQVLSSGHELHLLVPVCDHGEGPKTTVRQGAYETLADARRFAQGYARRLLPETETINIESDDGMIRERWIWLNGQWERDDLT